MTPIQRIEHEVPTTRLSIGREESIEVVTEAHTKVMDALDESCRLALKETTKV
jgi:hypothetical protein